jgi:hypothetical protein
MRVLPEASPWNFRNRTWSKQAHANLKCRIGAVMLGWVIKTDIGARKSNAEYLKD